MLKSWIKELIKEKIELLDECLKQYSQAPMANLMADFIHTGDVVKLVFEQVNADLRTIRIGRDKDKRIRQMKGGYL